MIDARASLQAAEGLSGSAIAAYLLNKGWAARPSRMEGFSILTKQAPGANKAVELILPIIGGFDEEPRRVADALRAAAQFEGRPVKSIADEIRQTVELPADPRHESSPDKIALKVLESIESLNNVDPIEFLETSAEYANEEFESGKPSAFLSYDSAHRHKLEIIWRFFEEKARHTKVDEVVQLTRELFEYQFHDAKNHVLADLEAHKKHVFAIYLDASHPLTMRIQSEMYLTQLALIIGLFRVAMEASQGGRVSKGQFPEWNRIVTGMMARHSDFLYRTLETLKAELIAHDVI